MRVGRLARVLYARVSTETEQGPHAFLQEELRCVILSTLHLLFPALQVRLEGTDLTRKARTEVIGLHPLVHGAHLLSLGLPIRPHVGVGALGDRKTSIQLGLVDIPPRRDLLWMLIVKYSEQVTLAPLVD